MSEESVNEPSAGVRSGERAHAMLSNFLSTSSAALAAATSLRAGAEVAITLTDIEGDWRIFRTDDARIAFEPGKAVDPDFDLTIPPAAVQSICSRHDSEVGELGITFFEHLVEKDPALKIKVKLHSGFIKLTGRGWLTLLARGGPKVVLWLAGKGLRGPGGVATALGRLKR